MEAILTTGDAHDSRAIMEPFTTPVGIGGGLGGWAEAGFLESSSAAEMALDGFGGAWRRDRGFR